MRDRPSTPRTKRAGERPSTGNAKEMWDAVIVRCRGDRLAVGRPRRSALQIERIGHDPRVRAVGLHRRTRAFCPCCRTENAIYRPSGEIAGPPKTCAPRPLHNSLPAPLASFQMLSLVPLSRKHTEDNPDRGAGRTPYWYVSGIRAASTTSAGESEIAQSPERSPRTCARGNETAAVGAGRQRRVPVKAGGQPVRTAALNVHAVKPRARTIRIGGEVKERPPVQKDRMTDARVVRRDLFRPSATEEKCARCPVCPEGNPAQNR